VDSFRANVSALSLFVIDSLIESRYTPAAPKGVSGKSYLTIEFLAIGSWLLARKINSNHNDFRLATLCRLDWDWVWDWVTLGSPKRHPRETQASRMGHARVDFGFGLCFQQKLEKGRVGR
jgi:hypothetical protein